MLLFGIGVGVPIVAALLLGAAHTALYAGAGAMLALQTDPRRSVAGRLLFIGVALALIVGAATLGVELQGRRHALEAAVLAITFVAGLPKPVAPYLTLVGKVCAAVVVITGSGFAASGAAAWVFIAGGLFAAAATAVEARFPGTAESGMAPDAEFRAVFAGDTNPLFYAVTLASAMALAIALADALHAHFPGWVGLTVLMVMHPDDAVAFRLMAKRIGATLAGILVAGILVALIHTPWPLAALAILLAFALPRATAAGYFTLIFTLTVFLMLLLDLSLLATGGDAPLLQWRLYDTVLGCLIVAAVLSVVHAVRRFRAPRAPGPPGSHRDADVPESPVPPSVGPDPGA
jgi:hypothetical protein